MREIDDILLFREDISPFLVHLTRDCEGNSAKKNLESIIERRRLIAGTAAVSDGRFGIKTVQMDLYQKQRYFSAVCLTETPINEIHCLLEIRGRQVDLQPYGLVFLKTQLQIRGVSPVVYVNNETGDGDVIIRAMASLINTHPEAAAKLLPLVSVFGNRITPPGAAKKKQRVDFRWEREWRFPHAKGPLEFSDSDLFVGLCPQREIKFFERKLPGIDFIDPTRNMKWYATKLIAARHRLNLKNSVV